MFGNMLKFVMRSWLQVILLRYLGWLIKLIPVLIVGLFATSLIKSSGNERKSKTELPSYPTDKRNPNDITTTSSLSLNKFSDYPANILLWEQPSLLNVSNFRWIMNNRTICQLNETGQQEKTRVVIIIVHSAREHFVERLAIRRSYGSLPMYKRWVVRIAFMLGEPHPTQNFAMDLNDATIFEEKQKYGDLIMGSFVDSYNNLTYKHIMGYKWVLNFCPDAEFVLKVDDDIFIDLMRWLDWRSEDLKILETNRSAIIPDMYGFNWRSREPERDKNNKWYATKEDWPDRLYPFYCLGWAYGININLMKRLYLATPKAKFYWIDDVFVTGVLLDEAKAHEPKPEVKYLSYGLTDRIEDYRSFCEKKAYFEKRKFEEVVFVERGEFLERDMMCLWNKTMHDTEYKFTN